jgi:hypothetical protein
VRCTSITTLRRAFKAELAFGRELVTISLGMRLYNLATHDGPHSFSACCFLLCTFGGPQWRLPKDTDDPRVPATDEADNNVVIYLPENHRDHIPDENMVEPPTIDAQVEPCKQAAGDRTG